MSAMSTSMPRRGVSRRPHDDGARLAVDTMQPIDAEQVDEAGIALHRIARRGRGRSTAPPTIAAAASG